MPWSFVVDEGRDLDIDGIGRVNASIAFGGVFYLLVDAASLGIAIDGAEARHLVDLGMKILRAARENWHPVHPGRPAINGLAYLMFMSEGPAGRLINATIMPPGRIDRSPCGTGSSARLALLQSRGTAKVGDTLTFHSIIGSRFDAGILEVGEAGGRPAIRPWISGRGWVFGKEQLFRLDNEPFPEGHALADTYGPGVGE
jgi:proline racemase